MKKVWRAGHEWAEHNETVSSSEETTPWRDRLRPLVKKISPATRVLESVARLAVQVQKPTILGISGMVSAGVNVINELVGEGHHPGWRINILISRGYFIEAFRRAGASVEVKRVPSGLEIAEISMNGCSFTVTADNDVVFFGQTPTPVVFEWFRQVLDPALPGAIKIHREADKNGTPVYESPPLVLSSLKSKQGAAVLEATLPLLEGGRCILLEGRPGVGKTTMAQEIARSSSLGRTILLADPSLVGSERVDASYSAHVKGISGNVSTLEESMKMLSPGVVIVDDVDKINLQLSQVEALRKAARLVIFTANNGKHDDVIDGSLIRPGRVDEVFTIEPEHALRRSPFDILSDTDWEEIRDWPIAYLNEVEKRLLKRPNDVRLNDLRERVNKRTRSGSALY